MNLQDKFRKRCRLCQADKGGFGRSGSHGSIRLWAGLFEADTPSYSGGGCLNYFCRSSSYPGERWAAEGLGLKGGQWRARPWGTGGGKGGGGEELLGAPHNNLLRPSRPGLIGNELPVSVTLPPAWQVHEASSVAVVVTYRVKVLLMPLENATIAKAFTQ